MSTRINPGVKLNIEYICTIFIITQSPKFKRVSLNETPEFSFRGLNICVDFNLRDSEKRRV